MSDTPWFEFPDALVQGAFSGDPRAEDQLWVCVRAMVVRFARSIGRRPNIRIVREFDIDDVVQNALVSLIVMGPERLQAVRDWPRFLYTVTYFRSVEHVRRRSKGDGAVSLDAEIHGEDGACTLAYFVGLPPQQEDAVEHAERRTWFAAFLETLPKDSRSIVRLYVEGYSYLEIEERTGMAVNKATIRVYRANLALNDWLREQNYAQERVI